MAKLSRDDVIVELKKLRDSKVVGVHTLDDGFAFWKLSDLARAAVDYLEDEYEYEE